MIIDVSTWQGEISWPAVKAAGVELAIIKATEGIGFTDPRFAANWAGAKAAGVPRGAYAFVHPDAGNDPIAEADYFVSVVKAHGLEAGDVLAEDYEVPGGFAAWSLAWLGRVQAQTAILPEFYSNYSGCYRVASDARMARYPLWLAYPGDGVHIPPCPAPWSAIRLLQYAVGRVPGIAGNVDEDVNLGLFTAAPQTLTAAPRRRNYVVATSDQLHLFVRGTPDANGPGPLWHARWQGTGWTWVNLGGELAEPDIAVWQNGQRIDLFVEGASDAIWHLSSDDGGATWSSWENTGGTAHGSLALIGRSPAAAAATAQPVDLSPVLSAITDLRDHPAVASDPVLLDKVTGLAGKVTAIEANLNAPRPPA